MPIALYGNAAVNEMELVRNIQAILSSLYNTGHCIPTEYTVDFASPHLIVSRTAASLYLMLFQVSYAFHNGDFGCMA